MFGYEFRGPIKSLLVRTFKEKIFAKQKMNVKRYKAQTVRLLIMKSFKSGCQRKPGKMLNMSTEGGQQNKLILTS